MGANPRVGGVKDKPPNRDKSRSPSNREQPSQLHGANKNDNSNEEPKSPKSPAVEGRQDPKEGRTTLPAQLQQANSKEVQAGTAPKTIANEVEKSTGNDDAATVMCQVPTVQRGNGAIPKKLKEVVAEASASAPAPTISTADLQKLPQRNSQTYAQIMKSGYPLNSSAVSSAVSFAQMVSNTSKRPETIELQGKFVFPRPKPSDSSRLRAKNDVELQELFASRWHTENHGVCIELIRGVSKDGYVEAICQVIPQSDIFAIGLIGQSTVSVTLNSAESATELMLKGIEIRGRQLNVYPEAMKPQRVVLSPVPARLDDDVLSSFLNKYGKVNGRIRAIPINKGPKGLGKGIFSLSREAFVTLNKDAKLPSGFLLNIEGNRTYVEVMTEPRCYACKQVGHFIASCPKKAAKPNPRKAAIAPNVEIDLQDYPLLTDVRSEESNELSNSIPISAPTTSSPIPVVESGDKTGIEDAAEKVSEDVSSDTYMECDSGSLQGNKVPTETPKKKNKNKKKKGDQKTSEVQKPISQGPHKRPHSEDEREKPKEKIPALSEISDLSDDMGADISEDTDKNSHASGYESEASLVSVDTCNKHSKPLSREQLGSLLDDLRYKKEHGVIRETLLRYTDKPMQIITQLRNLDRDARKRKKYSLCNRIKLLIEKIESLGADLSSKDPILG